MHLLTDKYNFSDLKISHTDPLRHAGCFEDITCNSEGPFVELYGVVD